MFVVIGLIVTVALALLICYFTILLAQKAVLFSKITFSLFVALVLNGQAPILEGGGLLSFVIYAIIVLGCCFVLCLSPRFDCAFQFFCTMVISFLVVEMLLGVFAGIFLGFLGRTYEPSILSEVIIKVVCFLASGKALLSKIGTMDNMNIFTNKILIIIERTICSVFYGFSIYFLFAVSANNVLELPGIIQWIIFLSGTAIAFALDLFCFSDSNDVIQCS